MAIPNIVKVKVNVSESGMFTWSFSDARLSNDDQQEILSNIPEGHIEHEIAGHISERTSEAEVFWLSVRL
jgi:hypothetical protein